MTRKSPQSKPTRKKSETRIESHVMSELFSVLSQAERHVLHSVVYDRRTIESLAEEFAVSDYSVRSTLKVAFQKLRRGAQSMAH